MRTHPAVRKVCAAVTKYCPPGSSLVLAVSGGADSLALADAAALVRAEARLTLTVVHVEHGLRGEESLGDAAAVAGFCRARELHYTCVQVQAGVYARQQRLSVEAAARELRYAALRRAAAACGADFIVTAHHRDDQAETVLLRLLRGTSASGLGGMDVRAQGILRPFLNLGREELERYCRLRGISWRHDSSNDDCRHTRNRVRCELLPYLERSFNPGVRRALVQAAELLREDEACLAELVEAQWQRRVSAAGDALGVDVSGWAQQAAAVRKRLLRRCYFTYGGAELGYAQTEALDRLCLAGRSGKVLPLPGGIIAAYAYQKLRLYRTAAQARRQTGGFCVTCRWAEAGKVSFPGGCAAVRLLRAAQPPLAPDAVVYPQRLLQGELLAIRSRRPGDRFAPYGGTGSKKLKEYFIDRKVPQAERAALPLVCNGGRVLGIAGLANAAWEPGEYDSWLSVQFTRKE